MLKSHDFQVDTALFELDIKFLFRWLAIRYLTKMIEVRVGPYNESLHLSPTCTTERLRPAEISILLTTTGLDWQFPKPFYL